MRVFRICMAFLSLCVYSNGVLVCGIRVCVECVCARVCVCVCVCVCECVFVCVCAYASVGVIINVYYVFNDVCMKYYIFLSLLLINIFITITFNSLYNCRPTSEIL